MKGIEVIKSLLLQEHSKKQTVIITDLVIYKNEKLCTVFDIIKQNEPILSQRAAWVLAVLAEKSAVKLVPFIPDLISFLKPKYHNAVLRASSKALAKIEIPLQYKGELFDVGMNFLNNKKTATAIKTWIIDILVTISKDYPELQNELYLSLKDQIKQSEKGIRGKMTKVIQKLELN